MIASIADYRTLTGDSTTASSTVSSALVDAQSEMEQVCSRRFEYDTYTETLRLYPTGRVYPKGFPIETVAGSAGSVVDGASVLVGYGFQYASGINPFVSGFGADTVNYQPQVTLTYTGGYKPSAMPVELKRVCCAIAYSALHPVVLEGVPAGANNVRIGDAGYSGTNLGRLTTIDRALWRRLQAWRRPQVIAF